jgi:hypothetical protein
LVRGTKDLLKTSEGVLIIDKNKNINWEVLDTLKYFKDHESTESKTEHFRIMIITLNHEK